MGLIRLLLAVAVVLYHCRHVHLSLPFLNLTMTGGEVSVEVFFMISGFYMAMILNEKYTGPGSFKTFAINRALRLFPIYWFVAALQIIFFVGAFVLDQKLPQFILDAEHLSSFPFSSWLYVLFTNLVLVGQDWSMLLQFDPAGHLAFANDYSKAAYPVHHFYLVPQAWSLGTELTFYAMAPFLVRRSVKFLIVITALSFLIRIVMLLQFGSADPWSYQFCPSEMALFFMGALGYKLRPHFINHNLGSLPPIMTVCFIILVLAYPLIPAWDPVHGLDCKRWLFYGFALFAIPFTFDFTHKNSIDRTIGELSYPVYISHVFVIGLLLECGVDNAWVMLAATLGFSALLMRYLVNPLDLLRQQNAKKLARNRA